MQANVLNDHDVTSSVAENAPREDSPSRHERPQVITLGDLGDVQNGYDGNNYDWSEWYYFDY